MNQNRWSWPLLSWSFAGISMDINYSGADISNGAFEPVLLCKDGTGSGKKLLFILKYEIFAYICVPSLHF